MLKFTTRHLSFS
ncbi:rCG44334 [Rattus norvegicus]|uniref:RCG44334 n=1 Tax=Rattus norvegicus TaxID=10116 RepID=A6KD90_RAT|nr:rCG44334 [Rattus norvegicus]